MSDFNNTPGTPASTFLLTDTSFQGSKTEDPPLSFVLSGTSTGSHGSNTEVTNAQKTSALADSGSGPSSGTQTSITAVTSAATVTPPPPTPSPSTDTPASPTAEVAHKPSSSTGVLAGGVCGGTLIFVVLATCFHLRRRRRRCAGYPRHPSELAPEPFTPMDWQNIHSANKSAVVRTRMHTPKVNGVQNKMREDGIQRHNKPAPTAPSVLASSSSQSTTEKQSQWHAITPQKEEGVEDSKLSPPGSSREALLEEVAALRMRIRLIEGLETQGPRPSGGPASA